MLRWRTLSEAGVLGFHVYSAQNGRRTRLNRTVVPATAGLGGRLYRWRDRLGGNTTQYWLQELNAGGRSVWYGPARLSRIR